MSGTQQGQHQVLLQGPGPRQGFNHLGIITSPCCRPGAWEIFRDCWCFTQPIPLTGAGSWHFLPTLHPSGSLPAFARGFPGNSTVQIGERGERGEERLCCLGSSATAC